jgi:hypothetical protein
MSRVFGLVGMLIVLAVGMYIYKQQIIATSAPGGAAATPRGTVDTIGVRNDLMAIAQAERRYYASNGKYVSIEGLISSGELSMQKPGRAQFNYTADVDDAGFRIIADYTGDVAGVPKSMSIDQNLEFKTE